MPDYIDLHMHTTCSDGKSTPEELLSLVRQANLSAFSVTDHDTLEGYREVQALLEPGDPELITGVELSAIVDDRDLHLLVYLFDPDSEIFVKALDEFQEQRDQRARLIVEKLESMGLTVPFEEIQKAAGDGVIGRPHIAEAMAACGVVSSYEEAFRKYIHNGGPAYVPKAKMTSAQAIELGHAAGGLVSLAHPFVDNMAIHVPMLVDLGLDALEVYHYSFSRAEVQRARDLAARHGLLQTGGSDFHGRESRNAGVGSQHVPAELLDSMKQRVQQLRGQS